MLSVMQMYCLLKQETLKDKDVASTSNRSGVEKIMEEYCLDQETYQRVAEILDKQLTAGLKPDSKSSIKAFPTYVRALPDGSERGNFLALDLGGTNFRVLLIHLDGDKVDMQNKIYPISQELMHGHGDKLFDYIAECIDNFMGDHNLKGAGHLPLGFTFSFPCKQEGLAIGRLATWTKGFKCEGVEGEDVVRLLHEAITRKGGMDVQCVAILNDTVGCLMSCAFLDHNTEIGVILGTGTNACYMEKLENVHTWDGDSKEPKQVIINTEWGAFGDKGELDFLRTDADRAVDTASINPGQHLYEKMISGMYMGEIVRLIIARCSAQGLLLNGMTSEELESPGRFYTKYISEIEKDEETSEFRRTKQVLDEIGFEDVSLDDCRNVQYICSAISTRAASLASAGVACLLNRINKPNVTVAVDGSLYRFHPHFHDMMMQKTEQLLKPGLQFSIRLSEDGSGRGAALVAAVADRYIIS